MIESISPEFYQTALYLRFSVDDGKEGDSSSIQGQKLVLESFCKEHNIKITDVYIDDGWSGSNFERPDFKRMITDIEKGKFNLVLTKDLSRLGRDYILAGHYTEIYFPANNIRYIAVDDGYDTENPSEMGPIKNMFNDWYARDISKKVKNIFAQKQKQGQFISCTPPYGYIKDPENKNHFLVDSIAGPIVKEIFELTLSGLNRAQVARVLTERKIPVPSAHLKNVTPKKRENWEFTWNREMIRKIIGNQVYVGDMVSRKSQVISHKTKKTIYNTKDSNKRIIVQNTHEAVIGREEFEQIQTVMKFYNRVPTPNRENFFKGLIFCQECNHRMQTGGNSTKERPLFYHCRHSKRYPEDCSHRGILKYESIKEIVLAEIKNIFATFNDEEKLIDLVKNKNKSEDNKKKLLDEKNKINKRLTTLTKLTKKIYEDYIVEELSQNIYKQLSNDYRVEEISLTNRLAEIEKKLLESQNLENNLDCFRKLVKEFIDFETLTQEMVSKLIKRIEVGPAKEIDCQKTREINIYFYHLDN